jgi:hypothetical protein
MGGGDVAAAEDPNVFGALRQLKSLSLSLDLMDSNASDVFAVAARAFNTEHPSAMVRHLTVLSTLSHHPAQIGGV